MNKEEMRIAIADKCGWKDIIETPGFAANEAFPRGRMPMMSISKELPNYPEDLNAMHEAEKVLDTEITSGNSPRYFYSRIIYSLCSESQQPFRATASQRAEAFCRVFWPEKFKD